MSDIRLEPAVPVDCIRPNPNQPRKFFDEGKLLELATSIQSEGIISPVIAFEDKNVPGTYILIAGERRWRSAKVAGEKTMSVIVRPKTDAATMLLHSVIENEQRENHPPYELARAFSSLLEQGISVEEISKRSGKPIQWIKETLSFLKLVPEAAKLFDPAEVENPLSRAIGVELAKQVPADQASMATVAAVQKLTASQFKTYVRRRKIKEGREVEPRTSRRSLEQIIREIESIDGRLERILGGENFGGLLRTTTSIERAVLQGFLERSKRHLESALRLIQAQKEGIT